MPLLGWRTLSKTVIPVKEDQKKHRRARGSAGGRPPGFDAGRYKERNTVERCFARLKHFRRFATRYEKLKQNFQALVGLACAWLHLQLYFDTA